MYSKMMKIILTGQGGSYICSLPMEKKDSQVAAPFVGALAGTKQAFTKKGNSFRLSMEDKELAVVRKGKFELSMLYSPASRYSDVKSLLSGIAEYMIRVFRNPDHIQSLMIKGKVTAHQICRSILKLLIGKVGDYPSLDLKTYVENMAQHLYEKNELKQVAMYFSKEQYPLLKKRKRLGKKAKFLKKALELSNGHSFSDKRDELEELVDFSGEKGNYESKILQDLIEYRILKLSNSNNTIEEISKEIGKDIKEKVKKLEENGVLEIKTRYKFPIDSYVITI